MRLSPEIYFYPSESGLDFSKEFNSNSILLPSLNGGKHLLIDPGRAKSLGQLIELIKEDGLDVAQVGLVFLTHHHPDHVEAADQLHKEIGCQLAMSEIDLKFLQGPGRVFFERIVEDGVVVPNFKYPNPKLYKKLYSGPFFYQGNKFFLHDAPGHSPGGLCLHWPERGLLVSGDVFFKGSIGTVNLPGGNKEQMSRVLKILSGLGDVSLILCGHGPAIVGQAEIDYNYRQILA
ncbi:MAG: MBL fold metallo-hydrolase [Deltaproteobacteria bacterium]|jgi:glyoxylase-like metal-dependent hydrolase (beta-lactamase superfamily II)|nr:MBL fold metallo-hydrolase [Deltaproteobacteria bacterium]